MTMTVMNNSCVGESAKPKPLAPLGNSLTPSNSALWRVSEESTNTPAAASMFWQSTEVQWMQVALVLAQQGSELGEVPVGAILVHEGKIIGQGFNQPITKSDPTCHAEIVALRAACQQLENYRLLLGTTLYVTLEPCTMCIGALIHARLSRLVYATREPRAGMLGSQLDLSTQDFYNHKIQVAGGLLAEPSRDMLKAFFKQRRAGKKGN